MRPRFGTERTISVKKENKKGAGSWSQTLYGGQSAEQKRGRGKIC
jgi:hypothetical protein